MKGIEPVGSNIFLASPLFNVGGHCQENIKGSKLYDWFKLV